VTSRDFCFWLQGYLELREEKGMSDTQIEIMKRHLALVFKHEIDPSMGGPIHQTTLDTIHHKGGGTGGAGPGFPTGGGGNASGGGPPYRC
jgi:hypothetical protein